MYQVNGPKDAPRATYLPSPFDPKHRIAPPIQAVLESDVAYSVTLSELAAIVSRVPQLGIHHCTC